MSRDLVQETARAIGLPDEEARQAARARWSILATAEGSLGRLQSLGEHLAAIRGKEQPAFHHKAVVVFVADHGVTEEGVSAHPASLTAAMLQNLLDGGSAITVFARFLRAELNVVDVGVDAPPLPPRPGFFSRKVARGTRNFAREPAMSSEQARESVRVGVEVALTLINSGVDLLAVGDLGIGNTTAAAAVLGALTGLPAEQLVGPGSGGNEQQMRRKLTVVSSALERHVPRRENPWEVLETVGGFEIGAMAGAYLAAASRRVPVIVDGLTAASAALLATVIAPHLRPFLVPSHVSNEPGHKVALDALGLQPYFDFSTQMGEGTSAALQMGLCDLASRLLREMATTDEVAAARTRREGGSEGPQDPSSIVVARSWEPRNAPPHSRPSGAAGSHAPPAAGLSLGPEAPPPSPPSARSDARGPAAPR